MAATLDPVAAAVSCGPLSFVSPGASLPSDREERLLSRPAGGMEGREGTEFS